MCTPGWAGLSYGTLSASTALRSIQLIHPHEATSTLLSISCWHLGHSIDCHYCTLGSWEASHQKSVGTQSPYVANHGSNVVTISFISRVFRGMIHYGGLISVDSKTHKKKRLQNLGDYWTISLHLNHFGRPFIVRIRFRPFLLTSLGYCCRVGFVVIYLKSSLNLWTAIWGI